MDDELPQGENLPKTGKVHEMCREWLVREDGAFAYRLQSQEINDHYKHNKYKNAQVREDFPCALDEQIREQKLAEQAAAVYQKMLAEQEEIDNLVAKDLALKLEREEREKRKVIEQHDEGIARQLIVKERIKLDKQGLPIQPVHQSPQKPSNPNIPPKLPEKYTLPHRPDATNYFANLPPNIPRRQALAMPLPTTDILVKDEYMMPEDCVELYTEPYRSSETYKTPEFLVNQFDRIDIQEIGVPIDEVTERRIQEERDAELARQLQEQEGNSEEVLLNRDRMLAIEAQDKELAKLLQERERAKAKRARERAKQKALAKKQQLEQQQAEQYKQDVNQLMPDDSYSYPIDVVSHRVQNAYSQNYVHTQNNHKYLTQQDDINYSFPLDVIPSRESYDNNVRHNYTSQKSYDLRYAHDKMNGSGANNFNNDPGFGVDKVVNDDIPPPVRPTQLDLRSPLTRTSKPRFPDPEPCDSSTTTTSPSKHVNIAMAIDPTYPRKGLQSPLSYDTTSSTVTTSTSSSSLGITLPPPDISENEDDTSPVPPYMPIQGQRRTSSLEKKQKKRNKDGCRQQ